MDASEKINSLTTLLKDCSINRLMNMAYTEADLIQRTLFSDTKRATIKHMRALEIILDELYARWDQWEEEHNI